MSKVPGVVIRPVSLSRSDIATPEDDGETSDAAEGFEGFDGLPASHLPVVRQWLVIIIEKEKDPSPIDHELVDRTGVQQSRKIMYPSLVSKT